MRQIFTFLTVIAAFLSFFSLSSCDSGKYRHCEGLVWNTSYHITYKGPEELSDSVLTVLNRVGESLNVFNKSSLVSKVNSSGSTAVDRLFIKVYEESVRINRISKGMFDPTLSPLITAWGFGPGHQLSSDTVKIDSIRSFVGIGKTRLDNGVLYKEDVRTQFNFSALAKGLGCDEVAEMFRRNGVTDFMVEIGGEIALGGESPRRGPWKISIDKPIESDSLEIHDSGMIIAITDRGIATSGNYRNFHREGGNTFGHTISPVTGRPAMTDILSATVIAATAMEADAAATACMAAGSEVAKEIVTSIGVDAMLILSDSTIWLTPGFPQSNP